MGIFLIVMLFLAMLGLGWWEIRRSKRRFREAQEKLRVIYNEVDDCQDLVDSSTKGNKVIVQEAKQKIKTKVQ